MLTEVLVQIVSEVDDVDQDREAERRGHEDLPELDEHVAVEGPHHSLQAAIRSRLNRRFFQPIFERIDPLIVPSSSFMSPPRAVVPS